ncbi:hypothetical protein GGR51DRAFT_564751 [Nemania sp. FL0031]|nr:hypothetical protein GGR51DRAFT_564751 [Nemania sp. FL0031]
MVAPNTVIALVLLLEAIVPGSAAYIGTILAKRSNLQSGWAVGYGGFKSVYSSDTDMGDMGPRPPPPGGGGWESAARWTIQIANGSPAACSGSIPWANGQRGHWAQQGPSGQAEVQADAPTTGPSRPGVTGAAIGTRSQAPRTRNVAVVDTQSSSTPTPPACAICASILLPRDQLGTDWSPANGMRSIVTSIASLLDDPNWYEPITDPLAIDREQVKHRAVKWTALYATGEIIYPGEREDGYCTVFEGNVPPL